MRERPSEHIEVPKQDLAKKKNSAFIESFDVGVGEKVLRLSPDGSTDSWNVDTIEDEMVYISRSTSKKAQKERAIMRREELAQEQYTLETQQKLLENWPKIIDTFTDNLGIPGEKKEMIAKIEKVKTDAAENAALEIMLRDLDINSDEAFDIFKRIVGDEMSKDVDDGIKGWERQNKLKAEEKLPTPPKRGAISGLAFGSRKKTKPSEEVTELFGDPSEEVTTDVSLDEPEEKPEADLETRITKKDAAFAEFITKANIRSRKFGDRKLPEREWNMLKKETQDAIDAYEELAGENPSIVDEDRLTVMRAHLESIESHKLIGIAEVEYTPDDQEETKELVEPVKNELSEDILWKEWEHDMHIVENDIAARQASGKPQSAEAMKKDRESLKQDLDAYIAKTSSENEAGAINPGADKNIERAIAFLASLDVLIRKAELNETSEDEAEEGVEKNDEEPTIAPKKKQPSPSGRSSLMTDAIKSGYKPKPIGEALVDWIKNIFS